MTLEQFKTKVDDYLTNNITAMLGKVQLTSNERAELKLDLAKLDHKERAAADEFLKKKGIDPL